MMLRGMIIFFLLAALIHSGLPVPASAAVEWSRQQLLKTDGAPVDIAVSADGKFTFVLTDTGQVLIYSAQGQAEGTLDVGNSINGIESSPTGDRLFLLDRNSNSVQVVAVEFIQNINASGAPFKGPADAPVVIALFSDFQ
jgi:DNA-binding beta-propeller fold protein YncE